MVVNLRTLVVLAGVASCTSTTGGSASTDPTSSGSGSGSARKGSNAGFSANLSDQLKSGGQGDSGKALDAGDGNAATAPPPPSVDVPGSAPSRAPATRRKVKPAAEIAAIKLDLEPNWDRDLDVPGTISFALNVPNSSDARLFMFTYGYDVLGAPSDHDLYKSFIAERKIMTVTLDRQRGAAWYLEGTDNAGVPTFRTVVVFGGKRLVCGGSLYKDKASTALGPDLRDKVVAAAKKICETLAL